MVKVRLARRGKKKNAYYHIVVADCPRKRDGKVLDVIGSYDPHKEKGAEKVKIDSELYKAWRQKGAQPTETVVQILKFSSI